MKYLLLVSHGAFSQGIAQTLKMFAGSATDAIVAVGLQPDESAQAFGQRFTQILADLDPQAQFIVLADLIGGSPLTTVCNVLNDQHRLAGSLVLGGMNFPMALAALLTKDNLKIPELREKLLSEATGAIKEFVITPSENSDDDI